MIISPPQTSTLNNGKRVRTSPLQRLMLSVMEEGVFFSAEKKHDKIIRRTKNVPTLAEQRTVHLAKYISPPDE